MFREGDEPSWTASSADCQEARGTNDILIISRCNNIIGRRNRVELGIYLLGVMNIRDHGINIAVD